MEEEYKAVSLWKVLESQVVAFKAGDLREFVVLLPLHIVTAHLGQPRDTGET